ncbi:hypothetical protein AKJ62_00760 [candidate division MSBL1 archaeon SCGC-AAA259D14]|uniref:Uncharacterized protein n=2 Tax=candidate division MSBL1 TaxID=215777 RepID=A0A133U8F4_9EURY|nr:hypothetical protein AKJ62_00760 [candidate division MSBL1 archaeon SCGC-AAA259D14]KXA93258.1 hypothetical protein AKJ66_02470 [candidate division MSBL1 archaeon SCGC-AAA259E22]
MASRKARGRIVDFFRASTFGLEAEIVKRDYPENSSSQSKPSRPKNKILKRDNYQLKKVR